MLDKYKINRCLINHLVKLSEIETMKTNDRIINSWASEMLSNYFQNRRRIKQTLII